MCLISQFRRGLKIQIPFLDMMRNRIHRYIGSIEMDGKGLDRSKSSQVCPYIRIQNSRRSIQNWENGFRLEIPGFLKLGFSFLSHIRGGYAPEPRGSNTRRAVNLGLYARLVLQNPQCPRKASDPFS